MKHFSACIRQYSIVLALLAWVGCQKSEPTGSAPVVSKAEASSSPQVVAPKPSEPVPGGAAKAEGPIPAGSVELRPKWPVGNVYRYRMDLQQKATTEVPNLPKGGMQQDTVMTQTYQLSVLKDRSEGGQEIELEFLSAAVEAKMGEEVMLSFDSKEAAEAGESSPLIGPYRRMIGSKLKLLMNAQGGVDTVEGFSEWMEKLTEGAGAGARAMTLQLYTADYIKQLVDFSRAFPKTPVAIGDRWPTTTELAAGPLGKLALDMSTQYTGMEDRQNRACAALVFSGTMKAGGKKAGGLIPLAMDGGKLSGTTWFDPKLGALIESVNEQELLMSASAPAAMGGAKITSSMVQKITLALIDLKEAAKSL